MRGTKSVRGHSGACLGAEAALRAASMDVAVEATQGLQNLGFAVNGGACAVRQPAHRTHVSGFGPGIALGEMPEEGIRKKAPGKALIMEARKHNGQPARGKPSDREGVNAEVRTRSKEKEMPVQAAAVAYADEPAPTTSRAIPIKSRRASSSRVEPSHEAEATSGAFIPTPVAAESDSSYAIRDRVVLENLPLVKAIAIRVHESLPVHVELDDLVHAGILGLFDAATKFNPYKQVAFSSYAKHRIKGAMLDSLRQLDWASRDMRRRHKQVEQVTRDLCAELHRNPTEDEVAQKMGVEVSRWRQMALDLRNVGLISASSRPNENDDLPAPDFPGSPDTQPDSMCAREQMREKLELAMSALPERYRKVVTLYYSNELTMKEIGGMLGINESRVSQIHKSALEKMAAVLMSNGITSAGAF